MLESKDELLEKIRLGEDSVFEMKSVHVPSGKVTGPRREDLADELAAFANSHSGVLVLGVEDKKRRIEGIPTEHLDLVETLVSPLLVTEALLKVQVEPTVLGDVNLDYAVNLTDPIQILGHLFGGGKLACRAAADFNEDAAVDMSDPIAILNALFLGGPAPVERDIRCTGS